MLGEPQMAFQQWGAFPGFSNRTVFDMATNDMHYLIDTHWKQFPPMNPLWHSILAFVLSCLAIVSCSGNAIVMYIFMTTKSLRTPSNMLVVNLAFSDFMMMFTMCPPMVWNCINETWVLGPLSCTLYGMAGSLWGCASIWSMTMIALDRYNVIVKGLSAKPMTMGGAAIRILFVWASCLAWTAFPLFGWNRYVPEGNMTACGTDYLTKDWFSRSYILVYGFWVYFTPLFMIIYSYYYILKAVVAHEKNMREQAKKMNVSTLRTSEAKAQSTEAKLAKVALMTISLWFVAWTPYLIINFAGVFELAAITPLSSIWGSVFAKANAVYNPIVYGISHPKYQAALYKRFPALSCRGQADDNVSTGTGLTQITAETVEKVESA